MARTVLAVAQAYWDWAARIQAAAVAASAEERMLRLRRETQKLIEQDELPPAELTLLQAAVSEREIAGIGARQRSRDARFALARLYGMDESQAEQLAVPADALPEDASTAAAPKQQTGSGSGIVGLLCRLARILPRSAGHV